MGDGGFSPDGSRFLTTGRKGALIHDTATGDKITKVKDQYVKYQWDFDEGESMYFEFRGDKVLHCENHFEFMDFYEQMGLVPENSFATALGGEPK